MNISYSRSFQGAWILSTIINRQDFTIQYMGYTKAEATKKFRTEIRRISGN